MKLNILYYNIDFLEIKIRNHKYINFGSFLNWNIDYDNSSTGFVKIYENIFTYRKTKIKGNGEGLIFSLSIDNITFDLFCIIKGKKGFINVSDKFVFYSTFFSLQYLKKLNFSILEFYEDFIKKYDNGLNRLDIALDVSNSITELIENIFGNENFYSSLGKDEKNPGFSQTYYIKNPLSSSNRDYIFRIYDKILDSFKKQKSFLFPYLNDYEDVKRIELEMRPNTTKLLLYSTEDILKNKNQCVNHTFLKFLQKNINKKYFEKIQKKVKDLLIMPKIKDTPFDLDNHFLKFGHIPKSYNSQAHGFFKKIYDSSGIAGLLEIIFKLKFDSNGDFDLNNNVNILYNFLEDLLTFIKNNKIYELRRVNQILTNFQKENNLNLKKIKLNKKIIGKEKL